MTRVFEPFPNPTLKTDCNWTFQTGEGEDENLMESRCLKRLLCDATATSSVNLKGFNLNLSSKKPKIPYSPLIKVICQVHSNIHNHNFVQGWIWPKKPWQVQSCLSVSNWHLDQAKTCLNWIKTKRMAHASSLVPNLMHIVSFSIFINLGWTPIFGLVMSKHRKWENAIPGSLSTPPHPFCQKTLLTEDKKGRQP